MTELFYSIVNTSITASIVVIVVLALRLLFRKAPKWVNVLLWGMVAMRLVTPFLPVSIESTFSLMPKTEWIEQGSTLSEDDLIYGGYFDSGTAETIDVSALGEDVKVFYYPIERPEIEIQKSVSVPFILSCIWIAGVALMLVYMAVSCLRVHFRIRSSRRLRDNVYIYESIDSPFVFGIIKPRICLPCDMDEASMTHVIAHEQAHIRRRDHWWKPLGFLLLTVHWFNPLLWLSYILLCRDIEMACDEKVVRNMGDTERADYSQALLECSVKRSLITACPLAFGEVGVKTRIKSVLNYKKPAFWIVTAAVLVCIAAAVCFLTNPYGNISGSVTGLRFPTDDPSAYRECTVEIDGKIENNEFNGEFIVDGRRIEASVDLTRSTPSISYYDGARLESYGLFYIFDNTFTEFAFEIDESDEYVICGMSLDEFEAEMEKKNFYVPYLHGSEEDHDENQEENRDENLTAETETEANYDTSAPSLTLSDVVALSAKGQELTWSDFADYAHTDIGSGLYIWHLPIDDIFFVLVGGSPRITPMYVYLCAQNGEEEERIDIRDGGVEEFIKENTPTEDLLMYGKPLAFYVDLAWDEAERFAGSENITIDKTRYDLRHDYDGSTIWIQFYGITEEGWDDRSVNVTLVRDGKGEYSVLNEGTDTISQAELVKRNALQLIGLQIEYLETIMKANPVKYAEDIPRDIKEYEDIFTHGEDLVLEYIFGEFLSGGQTDLHGLVLWQIMMDLLNENEIIAYDAENGQDYFDNWLESARSVAEQHDAEWLTTNTPAIALVVSVTKATQIADTQSYDKNNDGVIQTAEFPCPSGETFGYSGEYADLYSITAAYYVDKLKKNASDYPPCGDLYLPSVRVPAKYTDENGNINYVVRVLVCVYYDIGQNAAQFPTPIYYDSGGMASLCRVIVSPSGELISVEEAPDGADSSWYYDFCGPYTEIAEALLGTTDHEIDYLFEMTRDFDELVSAYLGYYFS